MSSERPISQRCVKTTTMNAVTKLGSRPEIHEEPLAPAPAIFVAFTPGTAFLIVLSLSHHHALGTGYDLGIYDQVIWNLSHGRIWETTLVYETGGYYDHFEPILALLTPLYWLWPTCGCYWSSRQ